MTKKQNERNRAKRALAGNPVKQYKKNKYRIENDDLKKENRELRMQLEKSWLLVEMAEIAGICHGIPGHLPDDADKKQWREADSKLVKRATAELRSRGKAYLQQHAQR